MSDSAPEQTPQTAPGPSEVADEKDDGAAETGALAAASKPEDAAGATDPLGPLNAVTSDGDS